MRIVVTGAAGFIGSHLCEALLKSGNSVYGIDNYATGMKENILHLKRFKGFNFIHHNVEKPFPKSLVRIDTVYHLAAIASPWKYLLNKLPTLNTNVFGTLHALTFCHHSHAAMVLASTSEVYGDPEVHPQHESYWGKVNPIGPRACYDEGKRVAETYATVFQSEYRVRVGIARIFNTFGPQMAEDDGRPIVNFTLQAIRNTPITIYGSGKQTRSFCYVDDTVQGLIAVRRFGLGKGPFNIGNPDERSIVSIAQLIRAKVNPRARIKKLPAVEDDPQKRKPDIHKAEKILHWHPVRSFEYGLEKTIAWVVQRYVK